MSDLTAFQASAFQNDAFQVGVVTPVVYPPGPQPLPNPYRWDRTPHGAPLSSVRPYSQTIAAPSRVIKVRGVGEKRGGPGDVQ